MKSSRSVPNTILLGTTSRHKAAELAHVFSEAGLNGMKIITLKDLPLIPPEPVEDGDSFLANATLKAQGYAVATGMWTLTDDSGLCVDALQGEPGVNSAYYAGLPRSDERNNKKLLAELRNVPDEQRTARFVCTMVLARPDGQVAAVSRGEVRGWILHNPLGCNGFGYDPLFALVKDELVKPCWVGKTTAQLPPEEKNLVSHRGRAARAMAEQIRALGKQ